MHKLQKGFSMVTVLVLTTLASVVVFTSLKDTVVQERLGGNYQKAVNARMLSERAAFDQMNAIRNELVQNPTATITDIVNNVSRINAHATGARDLRFESSLFANGSADVLTIQGYGERYNGDALSNLFINFNFIPGGPETTPFNSAVVGCEGVANVAGGIIDSYDSTLNGGIYSPSTATTEANVKTIVRDSDIRLTGGSVTWGDVLATGGVLINGGATIIGSVLANNDIDVIGGPGNPSHTPADFVLNTRVDGDVQTQGNIAYQGGFVSGVMRAEGSITFTPNFAVRDTNSTGQPVLYRGSANDTPDALTGQRYNLSQFRSSTLDVPDVAFFDPTSPNFDTSDPDTNCDPLSIASEITSLSNTTTTTNGIRADGFGRHASFNTTSGRDAFGVTYTPTSATILGVNYAHVYHVDELLIDGATVTISGGDIAMYVAGDFRLTTNGNSSLIIEDGASLTLFVEGISEISQPVDIATRQITATQLSPFSLYSSYASDSAKDTCGGSDVGVEINATGDLYAAVYAPLANVDIRASGDLFGAVRGRTVNVCGSGDIHYDTALAEANGGGGTSASSSQLVFQSLQFRLNN